MFLYTCIICRSGSDQTMNCLLAALDDISKCRNTETMRTPLHEAALRTGESVTDEQMSDVVFKQIIVHFKP